MGLFSRDKPRLDEASSDISQRAGPIVGEYLKRFGMDYPRRAQDPLYTYQGPRVAGMGATEQAGQNRLSQYVGGSAEGRYLPATQQLAGTLRGDYFKDIPQPSNYDFSQSDYYQNLQKQLQSQGDITNHRLSQAGMKVGAPKSAVMTQIRGSEADLNDATSRILSGLYENERIRNQQRQDNYYQNERNRQLNILPTAQSIYSMLEADPYNRAQAGISLGSVPRQLKQAEYDADRDQFDERRAQEQWLLNYITSQYDPQRVVMGGGPSTFERGLDAAESIYGLVNPEYGLMQKGLQLPGTNRQPGGGGMPGRYQL